MVYLNAISIVFILSSLLAMKDGFSNFTQKLIMISMDSDMGSDLYGEASSVSGSSGKSISNIFSILTNFLYNISALAFFYYLTLKKRTRFQKLITIGLLVCLFIGLAISLLSGGRGGVVNRGLLLIATYYLLKPFINDKINHLIKIIGIASITAVSIPLLAITFSRFGEAKDGGIESITSYAGQNILYFNEYAFDNNGIRYGDRTIPVLKKMLLIDDVPDNFIERRQKYTHLKINDEVFVTYLGDFVLDFGPILALIIISLLSLYFLRNTKIKSSIYPFHKLILLHLLISAIAQGVFLYQYADIANLIVIVYLLIYLLFLFDYGNRNRRTIIIK